MRSLAPKKAESEFDDLLGQLVDELAMSSPSESAVDFAPEAPSAPAHVDSTQALAAEAAAAARTRSVAPQPVPANSNAVKIAAIVAAALSAVAITALFVFGDQGRAAEVEQPVAPADPAAELAAPEPEVALPPTPAPIQPAPVVVAPVPTPEPVVVAPVVDPTPVVKPKPRVRNTDKPKPPKPEKPSTDDEFDNL
jgi:hypothetical protein